MFPLLPILIFFISFATYLFTALPSIYWRDAPEFQAIGYLLDIAHPSGSPLYTIVIKLFTFIPMGSIAFKTTLVSAVFGVGLSLLLYWIIQYLLEQLEIKRAS
ncbi:MAG: protein O-mannosyl-transferase family, partial [Nitrospiria bacterium]